jgi:hypothetical protein
VTRALVLLALAADPGPWKLVDTTDDGITLSARELPNERVVELRAQVSSKSSIPALCASAYGGATLDKAEPDITTRKLLRENGANERVTYEQISAPVVSDRDYAVRSVREPFGEGGCRVVFAADNQEAPPLPKSFVRIEKLRGSWTFEPQGDGGVAATYVIFTDPGGSLPALFVEGPRKKTALKWVRLVLARAQAAEAADAGRD